MRTQIAPIEGRYEFVRQLGKGAIGSVDLVKETASGRLLALKRMHEKYNGNARLARAFEMEAQAMSLIDHPNVVKFIEYGVDRAPYLVMECLYGKSLDAFEPKPSMRKSLLISMQVCEGLSAIHASGIVHRDLKPDHIVVSGSDVKIIDFGYCKINGGWDYALVAGHEVGTPEYMAPEQTYTNRAIDRRADIYSLGVILYELISGSLPFEDDDAGKLAKMHRYDRPEPLVSIPRQISSVVMRAMEKKPQDRFFSASSMRKALESCLDLAV